MFQVQNAVFRYFDAETELLFTMELQRQLRDT
jgi:hypothetical protein